MAVVAVAVQTGILPHNSVPDTPLGVSWWVLAAAFAITESMVIYIPVRRHAHTISMSEIPLILGLVLASPVQLLVGRLIGSLIALKLYRRQSPTKLAFNLALFSLETVTAVGVFRLLLGDNSPDTPTGWLAILVAVSSAALISATMVDAAIAFPGNQQRFSLRAKSFASGLLISVGLGFLGTLFFLTIWYDAQAVVVPIGAGVMIFILIRIYGSLSKRHDELRAIYSFTNATNSAITVQDVLLVSLRQAVQLLRAEQATILLGDVAEESECLTVRHDGEILATPGDLTRSKSVFGLAAQPADHRIYAKAGGPPELMMLAASTRRNCAMIAPVSTSDTVNGALIAAGRIGPDRGFEQEDLDLLDALAGHVALILERAIVVEQLREEIAKKQEIIRSKDELIASVSHELRTPLTGILGFAETLHSDPEGFSPLDRDSMLQSIATDALDMSNLVEDLLTAARAQIGSLAIVTTDLSLRKVADRVIANLGDTSLGISVEGHAGPAVADDTRVRQILRNLLVNADRYGGDRVRVVVDSDHSVSTIRVCDNGKGIPVELQEVAFSPYETLHPSPTQPGSLGLGLSISRTLARLMGGELTYGYQDGWSVFELRLPRSREPLDYLQDPSDAQVTVR